MDPSGITQRSSCLRYVAPIHFAVAVVSPPGHPDDVGAFREVAQGLHHALQALGHDSVLTNRLDLDERPTIVLGGNLLTRYAAKRYDSDERCDIEARLAKLFASEVPMKVAQTASGHVKVRLCSRYGVSARTQAAPPGCLGVERPVA